MIVHKDRYYRWIQEQGVGLKGKVASSPDSYISYLNGVSKLLDEGISPVILSTGEDVIKIGRRIEGRQAPRTIRNYKSAILQYAAMVKAHALSRELSSSATNESDDQQCPSTLHRWTPCSAGLTMRLASLPSDLKC